MSEWISVKDRLPPDLVLVLGYRRNRATPYAAVYRQERDDGNMWSWSGTVCHEDMKKHCIIPTHWMYLPEPPNDD